jgi:hypothetical protein
VQHDLESVENGSAPLARVNEMATLFETTLTTMSPFHPLRSSFCALLGAVLRARHMRLGSIGDLNRSVDMLESAAGSSQWGQDATPIDELCNSLQLRFERTGAMRDLDRCIELRKQALDAISPYDTSRSMLLSGLGTTLTMRFKQSGNMEDLEQAVLRNSQAVDLPCSDANMRSVFLCNLGLALSTRFEGTERMDDINRIIELYQEAIPLSSQVQSVATAHNMLSKALALRHGRTGSLSDLNDAVKASDVALALAMSDDPQRPSCLLNLAVATLTRYKQTGRMADLNRAISASEDALDSMHGGDPTRALCLNIRGTCYSLRFELTYSMDDLTLATTFFQQASTHFLKVILNCQCTPTI